MGKKKHKFKMAELGFIFKQQSFTKVLLKKMESVIKSQRHWKHEFQLKLQYKNIYEVIIPF